MLRDAWDKSGVKPPVLLTEFASKDLMMRCLTQLSSGCDVDEALQALSIAKSSPISAGEPNLSSGDPEIARLLNLYEHKRKAICAIDFLDMVRECTFGLRSGTVEALPAKHFLVDEFQDIDPAQKDWLDLHLRRGADATAVGDDNQAIYGFRASMGFTAMTLFCDQFKAKRLNLSTNYRCSQVIIAASRLVIEVSRDRFYKNIQEFTAARGTICITPPEADEASLADTAIANFNFHLAENPTATFAVISRTNNELDAVEMACARAGAPSLRVGSASLLKKESIARRVALLTAVAQPFDKAAFVSAIHGLAFTNQGKSAIADFFANSPTTHNITESLFEASLYQTLCRDDATLLRTLREQMTSMGEDFADLNQETPTEDQIGQFVARSFDRCMQFQKETPYSRSSDLSSKPTVAALSWFGCNRWIEKKSRTSPSARVSLP